MGGFMTDAGITMRGSFLKFQPLLITILDYLFRCNESTTNPYSSHAAHVKFPKFAR
jgi:hypothetical protein